MIMASRSAGRHRRSGQIICNNGWWSWGGATVSEGEKVDCGGGKKGGSGFRTHVLCLK